MAVEHDAFFFGGTRGDLFGSSAGERLALDVTAAFDTGAEVHPGSIRGPGGGRTRSVEWTGQARWGGGIEGNPAARPPASGLVYFDHEGGLQVGRGEGIMRHGSFVGRKVEIAEVFARHGRGDDAHVQAAANGREEDLIFAEPRRGGGVAEQ